MGWNDDPYAHPFLRWADRNKTRLAAGAAAGVAGLALLMNTVNFGPTQLGDGAPSPWMQGQVRYEQVIEDTAEREPVLHINGYELEAGNYAYPGIVQIDGDLTTDKFKLTADQIIVTGSVEAEGIVLAARQADQGNSEIPRYGNGSIEIDGDVDITEARIGSDKTTAIAIGEDVEGVDSSLKAGRIDIAGYVLGRDFSIKGNNLTIDGSVDGTAIRLDTQFGVHREHMEDDLYKASLGGDIVVHGNVTGDGNRVLGGKVQIGGDVVGNNVEVEGWLPEVHDRDVTMVPVPVYNAATKTMTTQMQTRVSYSAERLYDAESTAPAVTIAGHVSGSDVSIKGNAGVHLGSRDAQNVTVTTSFEKPVVEGQGVQITAPKSVMSRG